MPSDAIPAFIIMTAVIGLGLVLLWRWVLRPMAHHVRRTPCSSCGLTFTADDPTCPFCGCPRPDAAG